MTKKTLQLLASVALVAGMGFASITTASADTSTGTASTTGNVSLTAGETDPENPGDAGGITLKAVPFITVPATEIDGTDQEIAATVDATAKSGDKAGKVQVVNAGHKSDWTVQVASTAFKSDADTMNASTLTMGTATVAPEATDNTTTLPSLVNSAISFNTGEDNANQDVVGATYDTDTKEGVGTFNTTYAGTKLNLKAGNVAGDYASTLTWTLTNTPSTN